MAVRRSRERRPAIWPWLILPLIVLAAFYTLNRVRQRPAAATPPVQTAPAGTDKGP